MSARLTPAPCRSRSRACRHVNPSCSRAISQCGIRFPATVKHAGHCPGNQWCTSRATGAGTSRRSRPAHLLLEHTVGEITDDMLASSHRGPGIPASPLERVRVDRAGRSREKGGTLTMASPPPPPSPALERMSELNLVEHRCRTGVVKPVVPAGGVGNSSNVPNS